MQPLNHEPNLPLGFWLRLVEVEAGRPVLLLKRMKLPCWEIVTAGLDESRADC